MKKTKVGIRDISDQAGVAMSTVSHVLNGTAPISKEVRTRVLDVARELGYLAKRRARGAIAALSNVMIAVPEGALPQDDVNLVSWTILKALTRDCELRGLEVVPHELDVQAPVTELVEIARSKAIDGIILINDDRPELLAAISASAIPSVLINGEDPNMLVDSVTPGNRFAAQRATRHLIAAGHRKIMHVSWPGRQTVQRRLDGFMDVFSEEGLPPDDAVIVMADGYEPEMGELALRRWLKANPDLDGVTAIFCAADNLAFGVVAALREAGYRVPVDVSVIGFDGVALGALHSPPLTTVMVPLEQFGGAALDLLQQRAQTGGTSRAAHRLELGCDIIERSSISSPRRI